jgi:hypothetical protein
MYNNVNYIAKMDREVVYEVFNMATGQWEESVPPDEKEAYKALETYLMDYEAYEAEKEIIIEIIRQRKALINREKD